jgi:RNA 2',3'-cyclic 3'-phosphodiesterase
VSSARIRLFIAASIPEKQLMALDEGVRPLRRLIDDARWPSLENQHITLKFLGWTDVSAVDEVVEAMKTAASRHGSAEVALRGVGAFPNTRRARVIWAGIDDASGLLTSIANHLDELSEPLGFEREARAYTPHLTLARIKRPRPVDLGAIDVQTDPWQVSAIHLFRSHLSPRGARYEVVSSADLAG